MTPTYLFTLGEICCVSGPRSFQWLLSSDQFISYWSEHWGKNLSKITWTLSFFYATSQLVYVTDIDSVWRDQKGWGVLPGCLPCRLRLLLWKWNVRICTVIVKFNSRIRLLNWNHRGDISAIKRPWSMQLHFEGIQSDPHNRKFELSWSVSMADHKWGSVTSLQPVCTVAKVTAIASLLRCPFMENWADGSDNVISSVWNFYTHQKGEIHTISSWMHVVFYCTNTLQPL